MANTRSSKNNNSTANLGFEQKLWLTADTSSFSLSPFDCQLGDAFLLPSSVILQTCDPLARHTALAQALLYQ